MSGAADKTGVGAGSGEWQTPDAIYIPAWRRWRFTYDAAASHENAREDRYSTIEGTFVRRPAQTVDAGSDYESTAEPMLIERVSDKDGLTWSWWGERVWVNPPYSRGEIERWADKIIAESNAAEIIVALLPAATDTNWFQRIMQHCHIDWLPQRVRFIHPPHPCGPKCPAGAGGRHVFGKPGDSPPTGHVLAVPRRDWRR